MTENQGVLQDVDPFADIGGTEIAGTTAAKADKRRRRALRVAVIALLEIALLAAGIFFGYTYAKSTIEPVTISNYKTLEDLRAFYKPSAVEMKKDVAAFAAEENYYGMYKRVYYALLTAESVTVRGGGVTETAGGKVNIETEKKMESGLMYSHTVSKGTGLASAFGGNFELKQYFDIESRLAKVVGDKKEHAETNGKLQAEQTYVAKYGLLPYAFSNYRVEESTVLSASYAKEGETHVLSLRLAAAAAEDYLKQMKAYSGQVASFSDGDILYKMYFGDDFVLRKTEVSETYKVMNMKCTAALTEVYAYEGEEGYAPLAEEEKFANVGM